MSEWLVWVESVNFDSTILDTNDLSTIRGGGLAALFVSEDVQSALQPIACEPRPAFSGASQCAFRITATGDETAVSAKIRDAVAAKFRACDGTNDRPPHAYMMHVVSVAPIAGPAADADAEQALKIAEARARAQQFRQWTELPIAFNPAAKVADRFDGVRPATALIHLPGSSEAVAVSPSVKARREFGREARQLFYAHVLGKRLPAALGGDQPVFGFAPSFQHIVAFPPQEAELSVSSKIAVVYADGNGFGKARDAIGTIEFGNLLAPLRENLLAGITDWLVAGASSEQWRDVFAAIDVERGQDRKALRFETIMWGGDEMAFVMPAWLATTFVEGLFRHTAHWAAKKDGKPYRLTHSVGVAIGHAKVPIRQLRGIAEQAANAAKEAGLRSCNSASFEIFESLHPPDTDLHHWRQSVFGTAADQHELARQWALPGEDFPAVLDKLNAIVWGDRQKEIVAFPRSQLYAALRRLRENGLGIADAGANNVVRTAIGEYASRAGADRGLGLGHLQLPTVVGHLRGEAMDLALVATLWDYANPFGDGFPRFAAMSGVSK